MNNSNGVLVVLLCLLIVLVLTGKTITLKAIGLSVLITAALFVAAFGIYCLVEWIKENKKKQYDGK